MYNHRPWLNEPAREDPEDRQTASLLGIAIVLLIIVTSLFLVHQLRNATTLQDCVLSGRQNCDVLLPGEH